MRRGSYALRSFAAPVTGALTIAALLLLPIASAAEEGAGADAVKAAGAEKTRVAEVQRPGADQWVPSLSITSGLFFQSFKGRGDSVIVRQGTLVPVPLRDSVKGNDFSAAPFVGGSLELMSPELPIPTSPRVFFSAEILPTFGSERTLGVEGEPDCVRGPEPDAPCATEEAGSTSRIRPFGEDAANGQGTKTEAEMESLTFGASVGFAIPFRFMNRELRIKPYASWVHYKVKTRGLLVDAECDPVNTCTNVYDASGNLLTTGFLREPESLSGKRGRRFNAIGPGVDLEMDAARAGPVGISLYAGARIYRVFGDRSIPFSDTRIFSDQAGNDVSQASFRINVKEWLYRAHVGIRFNWLGQ